MVKLIFLAIVFMVLLWFVLRRFPALSARLAMLLRHPFVRTVLIQGGLRLIRFLIFRR